jgi:gentisate 1,2-dioxygenase
MPRSTGTPSTLSGSWSRARAWTVVGGDPVAMRRGDFLPQAGWNWHDSDSGALDLFRFSDSPVFEALQLNRTHVGGMTR